MPYTSRRVFRAEFPAIMHWELAVALVESPYIGFVAAKALHAPPAIVAVFTAAGACANLLAVLWASYARGREPRRMVALPLAVGALMLLTVFLTPLLPTNSAEGDPLFTPIRADIVFAAQVQGSLVCFSFAKTIRTSIWRTNYPDSSRGQIIARFSLWQMVIGTVCVMTFGWIMDLASTWFDDNTIWRFLIPITGLSSLASAWIYLKLPLRGRVRTPPEPAGPPDADADQASEVVPSAATSPPPAQDHRRLPLLARLLRSWLTPFTVLRDDPMYRRYQFWQMIQGSGMFLALPAMVLIIEDRFDATYQSAAFALVVLPRILMAISTQFWAQIYDGMDIWRFRARQTWYIFFSRVLMVLAVALASWPLLVISYGIQGVGLGAGNIAWQIGHMQFGSRERDADYMGVHVTLTGIRGTVMPFVGVMLYEWIGWYVIALSAGLLAASCAGFNLNAGTQSKQLLIRQGRA